MSDLCGAVHDKTGASCHRVLNHAFHQGTYKVGYRPQHISWQNTDYVGPTAPATKGKQVERLASLVDRVRGAKAEDLPIVRTEDGANAHEAAQRIEPQRGTARAAVLDLLREKMGEWIDAPDFTEVGGFAGTRRLRELRDAGWPIETRPKPGSTNVWQHRLVAEATSSSAGPV